MPPLPPWIHGLYDMEEVFKTQIFNYFLQMQFSQSLKDAPAISPISEVMLNLSLLNSRVIKR